MAKTRGVNRERTGAEVASIAGKLLGSARVKEAENWLARVAANLSEDDRAQAMTLLGALTSMRRVAASALTQRG